MGAAHKRKEIKKSSLNIGESLRKWQARRQKKVFREILKEKKLLKIVSHNIRGGIGTRAKETELMKYLTEESPDIMMIQEAKIRANDTQRLMISKL